MLRMSDHGVEVMRLPLVKFAFWVQRAFVLFAAVTGVLLVSGYTSSASYASIDTGDKTSAKAVPVTLRIHAWTGYAEHFIDDFQAAMKKDGYDVTIELQTATGLESFESALANNTADLISPAHDLATFFINQGLTQKFDKQFLPSLRQVNPVIIERLAINKTIIPYIAPLTFGPYAMAYRVAAFEEAPNSYRALWQAAPGKVSIADYDTANIYMTALMLGIPNKDLFRMNAAQLAEVEQALRELHADKKPVYWGENIPVAEASSFDIGTDWGVGVQQINKNSHDQWATIIPKEGATAWVDVWMLSAHCDPQVSKIAHAFVEMSLQAEIQARIARATSYGVTNMYASRHMTSEELSRYNISDGNYLNRLILWQPLEKEFLDAYQATWRRARQ
jgi:spermidine/putrescine-binding protein